MPARNHFMPLFCTIFPIQMHAQNFADFTNFWNCYCMLSCEAPYPSKWRFESSCYRLAPWSWWKRSSSHLLSNLTRLRRVLSRVSILDLRSAIAWIVVNQWCTVSHNYSSPRDWKRGSLGLFHAAGSPRGANPNPKGGEATPYLNIEKANCQGGGKHPLAPPPGINPNMFEIFVVFQTNAMLPLKFN